MRFRILLLACSLCISSTVFAEGSDGGEDLMTDMSAKMAQMKARMRAYQTEMDYEDDDQYAISSFDTAGCDINIGNVVVDDGANAPDEVVILIDGDVIQSNNCR
ncbi:hypothetical protein HMY34_07580 [Thiothrix subterranea]|uniref:hypothetical protein n=1 Tax=Thiothrix subterranea TaxID=2735563 RepID=UPI00192BE6AD|nr:hypothetical protein [Thiothrix subterranea]QQZ28623.1 hypothetical protein HMY34_07580 [Thiothrix subterranea]